MCASKQPVRNVHELPEKVLIAARTSSALPCTSSLSSAGMEESFEAGI